MVGATRRMVRRHRDSPATQFLGSARSGGDDAQGIDDTVDDLLDKSDSNRHFRVDSLREQLESSIPAGSDEALKEPGLAIVATLANLDIGRQKDGRASSNPHVACRSQ